MKPREGSFPEGARALVNILTNGSKVTTIMAASNPQPMRELRRAMIIYRLLDG